MSQFNSIGSKFLNRMFRKIQGLVWDISTGKLGIQDKDGIYTIELTAAVEATSTTAAVEASAQVVVNPFDTFGIPIPAFATNTPIDQVNTGDLLVGAEQVLGWVVEKKPASFVLLDKNGLRKQYSPPKVSILTTDSGVLVVKNLFNLAGGETGMAGLQGSLLPLLMLGGDVDLDSILPMLLFTQQQPAAGAANPMASMLPLMLLSKNGGNGLGNINPMMLMAMSGGLGGAAGMNPMMLMAMSGGLGGAAEAAPVAAGIPALVPTKTRRF